jgi:hypothetical protein
MSKTLEKWLPEELSRFHPCAVAEFDAFALRRLPIRVAVGEYKETTIGIEDRALK